MITNNAVWRGKVARYRKWEQRHDRTDNPYDKWVYGRMVGRLYVDLSNDARAIVEHYRDSGTTRESYTDPRLDERHSVTWTHDNIKFKTKVKDEDPERHWFQRNVNEPWFDLGYLNATTGKFQDTPVSSQDRGLTTPPRRLSDMEATKLHETLKRADHMDAMAIPYGEEIEVNPFTTPEELEAAATHALAEAARLRAIDDSEPTGDEPTISWGYTPNYDGARTYTYVAFKADNGRWYVTGERQYGRAGVSWRELYDNAHSANIRDGNYLIVTEWSQSGGA